MCTRSKYLYAKECKQWLKNLEALRPVRTFAAVKLNSFNRMEYFDTYGQLYMSSWVIMEKTY